MLPEYELILTALRGAMLPPGRLTDLLSTLEHLPERRIADVGLTVYRSKPEEHACSRAG